MTKDKYINMQVSKCTGGADFHTSTGISAITVIIITPQGV